MALPVARLRNHVNRKATPSNRAIPADARTLDTPHRQRSASLQLLQSPHSHFRLTVWAFSILVSAFSFPVSGSRMAKPPPMWPRTASHDRSEPNGCRTRRCAHRQPRPNPRAAVRSHVPRSGGEPSEEACSQGERMGSPPTAPALARWHTRQTPRLDRCFPTPAAATHCSGCAGTHRDTPHLLDRSPNPHLPSVRNRMGPRMHRGSATVPTPLDRPTWNGTAVQLAEVEAQLLCDAWRARRHAVMPHQWIASRAANSVVLIEVAVCGHRIRSVVVMEPVPDAHRVHLRKGCCSVRTRRHLSADHTALCCSGMEGRSATIVSSDCASRATRRRSSAPPRCVDTSHPRQGRRH